MLEKQSKIRTVGSFFQTWGGKKCLQMPVTRNKQATGIRQLGTGNRQQFNHQMIIPAPTVSLVPSSTNSKLPEMRLRL